MPEQTKDLNLVQKLAKIRDIASVAKREKQGYGYTYVDITAILAKVTAGMKKYGISLVPCIVPGTAEVEIVTMVDTKVDKAGKPYEKKTTESMVTADMVFKWIDDDNPEDHLDVPWFVVGSQADPSQSFGSGLSYSLRQFLTTYFQIAQSDIDPDAYRTKQKEAEASEERAIAEGIIEQFDATVKQFLADHPDMKETVVKFIARYAKKSDYFTIKEPKLAAKLLEDFKAEFLKED